MISAVRRLKSMMTSAGVMSSQVVVISLSRFFFNLTHVVNQPGYGPERIWRQAVNGFGVLIKKSGNDAVVL